MRGSVSCRIQDLTPIGSSQDHGVSQCQISTHFSQTIHKLDIVGEILNAAKQSDCGTVVVGRHRLPWVQDLFHHHTGEALVEKGHEFSVCVVGLAVSSSAGLTG
ncbi:MAG: hypothetical protein OEV99_15830 [Nitrospira sp.]|nr:hypothetical protein [Nitrospira sp.]MDH4371292.1 hypothetical protein [Nitrospira sp.]MDH5498946.1 hypothetical protein [Nitrospira sp.]MDH5724944.1 hypothetical protein [Nitrospira sp.]